MKPKNKMMISCTSLMIITSMWPLKPKWWSLLHKHAKKYLFMICREVMLSLLHQSNTIILDFSIPFKTIKILKKKLKILLQMQQLFDQIFKIKHNWWLTWIPLKIFFKDKFSIIFPLHLFLQGLFPVRTMLKLSLTP